LVAVIAEWNLLHHVYHQEGAGPVGLVEPWAQKNLA
ncbi:hypothetical protein T12_10346, partial [Trichinella patagoniensis]